MHRQQDTVAVQDPDEGHVGVCEEPVHELLELERTLGEERVLRRPCDVLGERATPVPQGLLVLEARLAHHEAAETDRRDRGPGDDYQLELGCQTGSRLEDEVLPHPARADPSRCRGGA